jgi:adenylate cyclase
MGIEIERKYLVAEDGWRALVTRSETLRQGYLTAGGGVTVRIRLVDDAHGFITIKSGGSALARAEFEYEIPASDAKQMLGFSRGTQIEKTRHSLDLEGGDWVVDEFRGRHDGLVIAEVELDSPTASLSKPDWVGDEVTGDPQYYNSSLAMLPSAGEI